MSLDEPMGVDLMFFGAHPDDIEIGAGGLVAQQTAKGRKVVLVDLTAGEMASNGTVEQRAEEAQKAAEILGVYQRVNLGLPDSRLAVTEEYLEAVVRVLRRFKPQLVFAPYREDRHPDHIAAANLVTQALFLAGLWKKFPDQQPHRTMKLFHYFLHYTEKPSFIVDITKVYNQKLESIMAHTSQFGVNLEEKPTELPRLFKRLEARNTFFGSLAAVQYGEGFYAAEPIRVDDVMRLSGS
ncbi:bacillithiol biosynthesis deacetylase BshB1 [Metallumcola ferriviriculae]|uniref:Bacillithiol biosynthesis deacetylase BshB1 n=1 Tax=Metallumcola ferriviriculae TaxID=3039180 RepID=A0AAU0UKS6_9FIRM|nr:bacillithiol biosynthesis deacetylase BshB1 [Desulfitibacteraceae bacterium MK1]